MRFATREEWREWLAAAHADTPDGVWIEMAKKSSGIESITHPEAVEVALCFGWIDSQRKGVDDQWFYQRFTPRRPRSRWSRLMREKAEELIASGAMQSAGLAEVERAKADGRWDAAYEPPSTARVPEDLRAALDANPAAAAFSWPCARPGRRSTPRPARAAGSRGGPGPRAGGASCRWRSHGARARCRAGAPRAPRPGPPARNQAARSPRDHVLDEAADLIDDHRHVLSVGRARARDVIVAWHSCA